MIRAHMATFPPRKHIMWDVIRVIAPQVDQMFVVLNEYEEIPKEFDAFPNVTAVIPDRDVKDAGKFWFRPAPDDVVFTVDDDILYPPDYVKKTLERASPAGLEKFTFGYLGYYWRHFAKTNTYGWQVWGFRRRFWHLTYVEVLGTGTTCMLGKNTPRFEEIEDCIGLVDLGLSRWNREKGILNLCVPRDKNELRPNLPEELKASTLLRTVNRRPPHVQGMILMQVKKNSAIRGGQRFRAED